MLYAHVLHFCFVVGVGCIGCRRDLFSIMRLGERFRYARRYVHHEQFDGRPDMIICDKLAKAIRVTASPSLRWVTR